MACEGHGDITVITMVTDLLPVEYRKLSFSDFYDVSERMSILSLFESSKRCGVYVLHFANNDYYVGQSVDIAVRFTQHKMNHVDIVDISYLLVEKSKLDSVEQKLISSFERDNFVLRNIALTSIPKGETDLQKIFPVAEQETWLRDQKSEPKIYQLQQREKHRKKYEKSFEKVLLLPEYHEILTFLREYFTYLVPEPFLTAMDFWRISCLPAAGYGHQGVLCRLNIYMQEVLTIERRQDGTISYFLHVAKSKLNIGIFERVKLLVRGIFLSNHYYKTGGADQCSVSMNGTTNALAFIQRTDAKLAIKTFNLRLMNKGVGFNKLSHCVDLAHAILDSIV